MDKQDKSVKSVKDKEVQDESTVNSNIILPIEYLEDKILKNIEQKIDITNTSFFDKLNENRDQDASKDNGKGP